MERSFMMDVMQEKENVLAGAVGAFLFALAGGILWFLLYQFGYLAGISGLLGVVCAVKGYEVFAKKESLKGVIVAIVAAVVVLLIAWYLCLSLDVYNAVKDWYAAGEVDYSLTFAESVLNAHLFLADGEILVAYLKDLAVGLVLCGVGAFRYVANAVRRTRQQKMADGPVPEEMAEEMAAKAPTTESGEDVLN